MKWIKARNLEQWAETIASRTALSELVSALVRASAADIRSFRFPTGDSAQIPGYDGRLTAQGAPPYIPGGESVWEFGVNADYLGKANSDYDTRTKTPGAIVPSETTFVFVTPRIWKSTGITIESWQKERREQGIWKDVQAIDGVALEEWLDQYPAVASWMARHVLDLAPLGGACSVAEYWDQYAARFDPALTEQVLLCDRDEHTKALIDRLAGGAQRINLRADSPDEVVAFAVAAIRTANAEVRKFLESRTLILDTEEAARQLGRRPNMIFIVRDRALSVSGWLAGRNPTIVPFGRDTPNHRDVTVLNRPTTRALGEAIATMGFDTEAAYQLARTCGRSVTILARRTNGAVPNPPWADGKRTLIPALLVGAWNANAEDDQSIVRALADTATYVEYEDLLRPLLRLQDPPIDQEGELRDAVWKIRAPVDAFVHLAHLIGRTDLNRLRAAATEVFGEYDPSLDLSDEDRPYAALKGKRLRHSQWLREGLATTLLQIAVLHEEAGLKTPGTTPQRFVEQVIEGLPG